MTSPTSRESDKFIVRLPDGMRNRIKAAAAANNRSMNAEIVATLEEKYPDFDMDDELQVFIDMAGFSGLRPGEDLPGDEAERFVVAGRSLHRAVSFPDAYPYERVIRILRERFDLRLPDPTPDND